VVHFKGTPKNPMSNLEVTEKARKLVRPMLSENQLDRLVETIHNLEKVDDVSVIGDLFRAV
jgi:2-methylcitrate dehydratase PrpD